ncbi:MAG: hypothetical protein ABI310_09310, partial [Microbacteriaceae bacterium]
TDQVDSRPTLLALTGLRDDYPVDGRVLVEIAAPNALPSSLRAHHATVLRLGVAYKQLLATTGQFASQTLAASTTAIASGSASNDSTYTSIESQLQKLDTQRDQLADAMRSQLLGAAFDHHAIDQRTALQQLRAADALLQAAATVH